MFVLRNTVVFGYFYQSSSHIWPWAVSKALTMKQICLLFLKSDAFVSLLSQPATLIALIQIKTLIQIQTLSLYESFSCVSKIKNPTVPVEAPNLNYTLLYFCLLVHLASQFGFFL